MRIVAVLVLVALSLVGAAPSIKGAVYESVDLFAGLAGGAACDGWLATLAPGAKVHSPAGSPAQTGAAFCQWMHTTFKGMGAYPKDLWIGNNTVAFDFHIRALSKQGCFVDWPQIAVLRFDSQMKITEWWQYYDAGWQNAQFHCKTPPTPVATVEAGAGNIKQAYYNNILALTGATCDTWAAGFSADAVLESPVGDAPHNGRAGVLQFCNAFKGTYPAFGAYPADLWIGGQTVATKFHIRALSAKGCHVTWPSVLLVTFDETSTSVIRWQHFYDDGWNKGQLTC